MGTVDSGKRERLLIRSVRLHAQETLGAATDYLEAGDRTSRDDALQHLADLRLDLDRLEKTLQAPRQKTLEAAGD